MSDSVLVDKEDGVMVVTINRYKARNAVNKEVSDQVAAAMDELDANADLRVAILTGAGGTFCAGMDLKAFVTGEIPMVEGRGFCGFVESPPKKPLITAVEGYALGGGCELICASDLTIAAEDAQMGIPEVKRGLIAGAGGLLRLPKQIPSRFALEMALTGELITAQRAYEMGLVNRVVEKGKALEVALEMARAIAANGPLATAASKRVMVESADWSLDEQFKRQESFMIEVGTSEDAIEGATAFAEKRAAVWKGK